MLSPGWAHNGPTKTTVRRPLVAIARMSLHRIYDSMNTQEKDELREARKLALRLVSVEHEARVALTEELHQGVQQILAALLIRLSSMGETANHDDMMVIRELLNQALDAMRTVTKTLVPAAHSRGLADSLSELGEILGKHAGLQLVMPESDDRRFPKPVEIVAYDAVRILLTTLTQEGLAEVSVSLHETGDALRVIIELYGFTKSIAPLQTRLQERCLAHVQGTCSVEIDSNSTTVVFSFPLGDLD